MITSGAAAARASLWTGVAAAVTVLLAGAAITLPELGKLFKTYALVSGVVALAAVVSTAALMGLGEWQSRTLQARTTVRRALDLAASVQELPAPPEGVYAGHVTPMDSRLTLEGGAWVSADVGGGQGAAGIHGTEWPSMAWDGASDAVDPLIAVDASTPGKQLLEIKNLGLGRAWVQPEELRLLVATPPWDGEPGGPYLQWTRLGEVRLAWLPGQTGGLGVSGLGGSSGAGGPSDGQIARSAYLSEEVSNSGILALLAGSGTSSADLFGTAAPAAALDAVYVLDGGAAPGAGDLGLPAASNHPWLLRRGLPPEDLGEVGDAAITLADKVEILAPSHVVFLPGGHWTVQDLVTLCARAVPQQTAAPDAWSWEEPTSTTACAIDDHLPASWAAP
jgi:hypothetical protein